MESLYKGKIFEVVRQEFPGTFPHDIVKHPPVVTIVAIQNSKVILIEQVRPIISPNPIIEVPAGFIEPGESILDAANRELEEECGCRANKLRHVFSFYSSPGFTDEQVHIVHAWDLKHLDPMVRRIDPDEKITKIFSLPIKEAKNLVKTGRIVGAGPCLALSLLSDEFFGISDVEAL